MNHSRIYTRKPLIKRIASNRWVVAALFLAAILALQGLAEAACIPLDCVYDARIGTAS